MDLSTAIESLQRGFGEIPPIAIALVLLAGPTAALIGYRLIGVARRMQASPAVEAAPLWVCHECRSVNEFRLSRCYRCGAEQDAAGAIEVIVDQPASRPSTFEAPAGSPFAALGATATEHGQGPGVPVMASPSTGRDAVRVGPGRPAEADAGAEADVAPGPAHAEPDGQLASTMERRQ